MQRRIWDGYVKSKCKCTCGQGVSGKKSTETSLNCEKMKG